MLPFETSPPSTSLSDKKSVLKEPKVAGSQLARLEDLTSKFRAMDQTYQVLQHSFVLAVN